MLPTLLHSELGNTTAPSGVTARVLSPCSVAGRSVNRDSVLTGATVDADVDVIIEV